MRFKAVALTLAGIWTAAAFHAALRAQETTTAKAASSVVEGVYTEEQAKRGAEIYARECSSCHGQAMEGLDMAPPLNGSGFISNWSTLTVGDLFERIRLTMPDGDPGKLSRQQNADVVAYILKVSKYPAGKTELPSQTEVLKQIRFEPPKQF
jgi:mono/diheme cytochrome c family protein